MGSRLGYPWLFTPTVVPEADWASRLGGSREARSASYLDEPAAGSRLRLRAPSWRTFLESEGGSWPARAPGRGPATCRLRTTWQKRLPAHAHDRTSPQVGGPPRPRPGPGVDSLRPEAARTSSCGGFGTLLGRNNREAWGGVGAVNPTSHPTSCLPGFTFRSYK